MSSYIPGSASLNVVDWETGESLDVRLDPLKSAVECAQVYFKRAKKQRRASESVTPLLESVDQEIAYMREVEESLAELDDSDDEADAQAMVEIQEELVQGGYMKPPPDHHLASKAKKKAQKAQSTAETDPDGLRLFTSPNGFRILIGRNNRQNDIVSKRKTKAGDLWFHARGVPGAHVLLKLDGKAQEPDNDDIQCAARLAAYYSKARNDGKVPVAMTRGENVSKPAGAPPGLVQIIKERTWNVKPSESLAYKESVSTSE